jgi:hypothetical protein
MNKYILITGAPGSKWSSVAENIYQSPDIDSSDSSKQRGYQKGVVKHQGTYFDPGMEFDNSKENWDKPFSGTGQRIIKSHTFAHQLDHLKDLGHPIVMVRRSNLECYDWWMQAGGFDITYPNYKTYYKDPDNMWSQIRSQNRDITLFIQQNLSRIICPTDNFDLCRTLGIKSPGPRDRIHTQNYTEKDIKVYVYR